MVDGADSIFSKLVHGNYAEAFLAIGRRIYIVHSKGGCKGEVLHIGRYDGIVVGNAVMEGSELPSLLRH